MAEQKDYFSKLKQIPVNKGAYMKELIEAIAKALVDHPDKVNVREVLGERTTVYELRVEPSDLGRIIGKSGKTARAIRVVLNAALTRQNKRGVLEILEP